MTKTNSALTNKLQKKAKTNPAVKAQQVKQGQGKKDSAGNAAGGNGGTTLSIGSAQGATNDADVAADNTNSTTNKTKGTTVNAKGTVNNAKSTDDPKVSADKANHNKGRSDSITPKPRKNPRAGAKAKQHLLQISKESSDHEPTRKGVLKQEAAAVISDSRNVVQKWAAGAPEAKCRAQTCHSSSRFIKEGSIVLFRRMAGVNVLNKTPAHDYVYHWGCLTQGMKFRFKTPGGGVGPNLKFHKNIGAVTMPKLIASIAAAVEPEELPKKRLSRQAKLNAAVEAKKARAQKRRNRKLRKAKAKESGGGFTDEDVPEEDIGLVPDNDEVDDFINAAAA